MSAFILSVVKTMIKITDNALAGRLTLSIEIFPLFCVHMAPIFLIIVRMRSLVKYEQQPEEQRILVEFGQIYVVSYDKSGWLSIGFLASLSGFIRQYLTIFLRLKGFISIRVLQIADIVSS